MIIDAITKNKFFCCQYGENVCLDIELAQQILSGFLNINAKYDGVQIEIWRYIRFETQKQPHIIDVLFDLVTSWTVIL